MRSSVKNINLTSVDDLFSTEESRLDDQKEKVTEIPLTQLHPFSNHPFKVIDNEAMVDTAESIKEYGVLVPAIVRPRECGEYELISGHRRHRASQIAGLETMPVIIRELNDNEAIIIMVDSNLQRESILPSEKAFAYKLKLEAIKMQGKRNDITSCQVGTKLRSDHFIAENSTESARQIQRFIRLTELIPQLLGMVDEKKIAFNPAVELSYLKSDEQLQLIDVMECEQSTPSLSQAIRLKKFSLDDKCTYEAMCAGHPIISTTHAGSPIEAHKRITDLSRKGNNTDYQTALIQAQEAFPIVVFLHTLQDNTRRIMGVTECFVDEENKASYNPLYKFKIQENSYTKNGKPKIIGSHKQIGTPSEYLIDKMKLYGISKAEIDELIN